MYDGCPGEIERDDCVVSWHQGQGLLSMWKLEDGWANIEDVMNSTRTGQMNFNRYLYNLSGGLFHTVIVIRTEYSGWRIVDSISASSGNGTRVGMTYSGEKIVRILDGEYLPFCSTCFDELQRMRFLDS
jgi:hypothetical protein